MGQQASAPIDLPYYLRITTELYLTSSSRWVGSGAGHCWEQRHGRHHHQGGDGARGAPGGKAPQNLCMYRSGYDVVI